MAYDPIKAHEYYEKYVKKGVKKGRKKGKADSKSSKKKSGSKKAKTAKKQSLTAVSTSGLNDSGKIEAAFVKEKITKEMNEALAKETTDEGKEKIRREYSQKAQAEMEKLKNDPKYAAPKKEKKTSAKTSGSKGSSKSAGSKNSNGSTPKTGNTPSVKQITGIQTGVKAISSGGSATKVASTPTKSTEITEDQKKQRQQLVDNANSLIASVKDKISGMTAEEKKEVKQKLSDTLKEIKKQYRAVIS